MIALALALAAQDAGALEGLIRKSGFDHGYALIAREDAILLEKTIVDCTPPNDGKEHFCNDHPLPPDPRFPFASISKQMAAVVTMQAIDAGRIALEAPIDRYLGTLAGNAAAPTVRQLLQHQSGLRNSNDSAADAKGDPSFYSTGPNGADWCLTDRKEPGGDWSYNNCDTIVLEAVLQKATGKSIKHLFEEGVAQPLGLTRTYYLPGSDPDELLGSLTARAFAGYGAAGSLTGTPRELLAIDRALLAGTLLSAKSRAVLWDGDPRLGYMAIGQWVFDAPLTGCARPVRIVERRGDIGGNQARNILLPDSGTVVILFTSDGDFDFGEIWQGKGLSHDLLAAVACP
ncbi:serine hydrolase domain-containing protein [Sphingomonas japonica]|uniref:CubicO group peptidase (Beta-lactamase class C family) n=1 Tax=Sphingomonas japonica TaxID=511662 RepID=A0ABX0TZU5_9SPHN|nr:serine hydrolase domain-containing protein [Sphingomonas japonica]NIJ23784.1 CubicO group peptidase (beta-lactamase class C family) [Sphingomonas japonica]